MAKKELNTDISSDPTTSKSERESKKRGSSYPGNPTDAFVNNTKGESSKSSKKETKKPSSKKKTKPDPTPDTEEQSTREDG